MGGVYHLFFHDDVDGIIGAALFLKNQVPGRYRLYPVSSSWRGDKFNYLISSLFIKPGDKRVIIDYQYHKNADVWIDHHFNESFGECEIRNTKMLYNPKSPSAARLVHEYIKSINPSVDYDTSFLFHVDIVDSGAYKSVEQIFRDKSPIMILRAYLERSYPSEMAYCRIVERIAGSNMNIKDALYTLRIGAFYVKDVEQEALKIKNSIVVSNKISFVTQRRKNQFPRYSEYLVLPDVKYAIRLTNIGNNNIYFQVGYNKWQKEPNDVNIGITVSKMIPIIISGGGHFNVAAGVMKCEMENTFIDEISKLLNHEEVDMEKYAVDKSDPIEQKAESMIKTGSAKNINEARSKASTQIQAEEGNARSEDKQL
jgi:oligoribonuclease NrnB/cAMP/cGMP phosphodiesterase (DHH superfamily)